jgi:hypothetical protein
MKKPTSNISASYEPRYLALGVEMGEMIRVFGL